ncbi:MAG: hypothetical protein ACI4FO_01655 [Acutalibacteraceae bacterium]
MKTKNQISYLLYIFKFNKASIISLIINFIILIYAIFGFFSDTLTNGFSLALFILPTIDIIWQCYGSFSDFKSYFFKKYQPSGNREDINYKNILEGQDWIIENIQNGVVAYKNDFSHYIRNNTFDCTIDRQATEKTNSYIKVNFDTLLPFLFIHYKDVMKKGRKFTNDKKLCLVGEIKTNENAKLCKGYYYNTYLTNKIFTTKLFSDEAPDIYPSYGCQNNSLRLPYEYFSNEIGVSTLAITSDGYLFLQRQGSKADSSTGLLVPSGSGSADWKDYHEGYKFNDIIMFATNRELSEEIGFGNKKTDDIILKSKIIGMFRWMNFGAKPEFVSLSLLKIALNEIKPQKSEQRTTLANEDCFKILKDDKTLNESALEKCWQIADKPNCSVPLCINLKFLRQYISEDRDNFNSFINESINN